MQRTTSALFCCLALLARIRVHAAPAVLSADQEPTTLAVYPAQVAPMEQPRLFGAGLPPAIDVQLSLACPDSRTEFDLGAAPTDVDGRLYRVYRTTDEGAWQPIRSTLVAG